MMQRHALTIVAGALALGSLPALAQNGDLAGVTMRVLDDLSDVDAVVLELDANRGQSEEDAAANREREAADTDDGARATAGGDANAEGERRAERRERDALHEPDTDERAEGRLEDRDVERSTAPAPAVL
jgi:hypothetical protein